MQDAASSRPTPVVSASARASYGSLAAAPQPPAPAPARQNLHVPAASGQLAHDHRIDVVGIDPSAQAEDPCARHQVLSLVLCMLTCFGIPTAVGMGMAVAGHVRGDFDMQLRGGITAFVAGLTGLVTGGAYLAKLIEIASDEDRRRSGGRRWRAPQARVAVTP